MTDLGRDPRLEQPPNFQTEGYAAIRQSLIAQNQTDDTELDDEWAVKQLLDAWEVDRQARQAAWDESFTREEQGRTEAEAARSREEDETRKAEERKRKAKFPPITPGSLPPKDSGFRPCEKAISKLKSREFIEFWFFTFAGCQATREAVSSIDEGTLSLTQEDGNFQLHRSASTASYKHLIVPDDHLTWEELLEAKNVFLEQIAKHKWPQEYLAMFTDFYTALELRPELRQRHGNGKRILILYHARARMEWFITPFDISTFNEDWMDEAYKDMWDGLHVQEIRKTEEKVTFHPHTYEESIH